jgi:hypothetical protein
MPWTGRVGEGVERLLQGDAVVTGDGGIAERLEGREQSPGCGWR